MSDKEVSEEELARIKAWQERDFARVEAWLESPKGKIPMLRALAQIGDHQLERMEAEKKTYARNSRDAREWQWDWMMATERDLSGIYRTLADVMEAVEEIKQELAKLQGASRDSGSP
jgi:hypothetical protein